MSFTSSRRPPHGLTVLLGAALVLAVAACSGPAGTSQASVQGVTSAPIVAPTEAPATATAATATAAVVPAGPTATAVPTSIDPCQLFTSQQASQLTGVTFGPGKDTTTDKNVRICTYGAASGHVFNVDVAVAPDVATAQAARAQIQAQMTQADPALHVTTVSGLGDNAVTADGSMDFNGKTLSVSGVYVLKGRIFFSLNDVSLGSPAAPSVDALTTAAQGIVAQLPAL